jgi:hypothetical protein
MPRPFGRRCPLVRSGRRGDCLALGEEQYLYALAIDLAVGRSHVAAERLTCQAALDRIVLIESGSLYLAGLD